MKHLLKLLTLGCLIGSWCCGAPVQAQGNMLLLGAGAGGAAPAAYTGPGDVKTGWTAFWGVRAYNSATRGSKLVNLCNSTGGIDVLCADASSSASTGALVIPGSLTSFCPGANCTIKTYYDISGATNCAGSVPCDQKNLTIASRAVLTASAIGAKACGVGAGAAAYNNLAAGNFAGLSQPYSVSAVVKFSSTTGTPLYFGGSSGGGSGFGIAASSDFSFYASNNVTGAAADTSAHAIQSIAATTSSFEVVDTTTGSTQSSGGAAMTTQLNIFADTFGNFMAGAVCEVGLYPAAFSGADATNLYNNQHTYWGF